MGDAAEEPEAGTPRRFRHVLAIANRSAGTASNALHESLAGCFGPTGATLEVHETAEGEDLGAFLKARLAEGVDLVIAAGGDGTVSVVADALVGSGTPLGVIPMGTANVLARELGIPLDLAAATGLLVRGHRLARVDAMKVGDRHYLTQLGAGLDALMIQGTTSAHKRRFGKLAYLWTAARVLIGHQPARFSMEVDGRRVETKASGVVVANVGTLGQPPFRWGPDIRLDDGTLDLCVSKAKNLWHYAGHAWHVVTRRHRADPNVRYHKAGRSIAIATSRPLPVQADGEVIGETPVVVTVVPGAVEVIAPESVSPLI